MTVQEAIAIVKKKHRTASCCRMFLGSYRIFKSRTSVEPLTTPYPVMFWTRGGAWKNAADRLRRHQK